MPEPRTLSFGILTRLNYDQLASISATQPSERELAHGAIASGLPCRCVLGHFLEQRLHFLHPTSSEHGIRSKGDPIAERLPGVDDKIACPPTRWACTHPMQLAQPPA